MLRVSRTYTHTYVLTVPMSQHHLIMHVHHLLLSLSLSLSLSIIFSHVSSSSPLSLSILSLTSVPPPSSHLPAALPSHPCLPSYSFLKTFGPFPLLSPILPSLLLPLLTHLAPPPSHLHNDGEPGPERLDPARWRKAPAESALPLTGRIHLLSLCMAKGER